MTVLLFILGFILVSSGFSYIFTPLSTAIAAGYFVVILMFVFGIVGIIKAIVNKKFGVDFAFSIISVILGIIMLSFPGSLLFAESVMLYISAAWIIMLGIVNIYTAMIVKKSGSKIWIAELIFGILTILIGIFSFVYPLFMAIWIGVMVGIFFIDTGITLIVSAFARD